MNKLIAILVLIAATAQAQLVMRWDGNTRTGPMQLPRDAQPLLGGGGTVSSLAGASWAIRNRCGYYEALRATAADGMVITGTAWPATPTDGVFLETITSQITQAEKDAANEAAEAERINTPIVYDQPIETPSIVLRSHEGNIGVVASDDGDLVTFTYHASPIPEPGEIKARKDAAVAARKAAKDSEKAAKDAAKASDKAKPLSDKEKIAIMWNLYIGVQP